MHNEKIKGQGYKTGTKRRPRSEWKIKHNTHEALISDDEAESLLAQVQSNARSKNDITRRTSAKYLLSGLLIAPDGYKWHGDGASSYKVKGENYTKRISTRKLDNAVIGRIIHDMQSDSFINNLLKNARRYKERYGKDPAAALRIQEKNLASKISKLTLLAAELEDQAPAIREINALEIDRKRLAVKIEQQQTEYMAAQSMANVKADDIRVVLAGLHDELKAMDPESLKTLLSSIISEIVVNPATFQCQIHYRIGIGKPGFNMASLNQKTSNQLLDVLADWNEYLEKHTPFFKFKG